MELVRLVGLRILPNTRVVTITELPGNEKVDIVKYYSPYSTGGRIHRHFASITGKEKEPSFDYSEITMQSSESLFLFRTKVARKVVL